jgi:hypothetical protein
MTRVELVRLADLPALTDFLQLWRRRLPELARPYSVEKVCKVDEALNTILAAGQEKRRPLSTSNEITHQKVGYEHNDLVEEKT